MLNYRYTQASVSVPMKSGAQFTADSYLLWTSKAPNEKTPKLVLKVRGVLEEKGAKWSDEWKFEWPDDDLKRLDEGFRAISQHVEQRNQRGDRRKEVFVDVYDWLRVGWVDENRAWHGYVRVSKEGLAMEAEFEDASALFALRDALIRAKNS